MVVEDEASILKLLLLLLAQLEGVAVVGTATGVEEALAVCRRTAPDLLILDLLLPDGSGLEVLAGVAGEDTALRVIVLSGEAGAFHCPPPLRGLLQAVVDKTRAYDALRREIGLLWQARSGGG